MQLAAAVSLKADAGGDAAWDALGIAVEPLSEDELEGIRTLTPKGKKKKRRKGADGLHSDTAETQEPAELVVETPPEPGST